MPGEAQRLESAGADAVGRLERVIHELSGQRDGLVGLGEVADGRLRDLARTIERQIAAVEGVMQSARGRFDEAVRGVHLQIEALKQGAEEAAQQAEALTAARGALPPGADLVTDAAAAAERMEGAAIEIGRALGDAIPDSTWQRLRGGDNTVVTRTLAGLRSTRLTDTIKSRCESDRGFRDLVEGYCAEFEAMLANLAQGDRNEGLRSALATSDAGRVHLMFSRALGRG